MNKHVHNTLFCTKVNRINKLVIEHWSAQGAGRLFSSEGGKETGAALPLNTPCPLHPLTALQSRNPSELAPAAMPSGEKPLATIAPRRQRRGERPVPAVKEGEGREGRDASWRPLPLSAEAPCARGGREVPPGAYGGLRGRGGGGGDGGGGG